PGESVQEIRRTIEGVRDEGERALRGLRGPFFRDEHRPRMPFGYDSCDGLLGVAIDVADVIRGTLLLPLDISKRRGSGPNDLGCFDARRDARGKQRARVVCRAR